MKGVKGGKMKLPTTKKESIQFSLIMCFGMVLVMTVYNLFLNGAIWEMTLIAGILEFLIGFIIALILDLFIVGPNAKKIAFKLITNKTNKLFTVLTISTCMVIGMAFFMSIYGVVIANLANGFNARSIISDYLSVFGINFIMALPLQILIMGPLVRYIFIKYIRINAQI